MGQRLGYIKPGKHTWCAIQNHSINPLKIFIILNEVYCKASTDWSIQVLEQMM